MKALATVVIVAAIGIVAMAADRKWQTGTWGEVTTKRKMVDFGPGSSPFGRPGSPSSPSMRAMADIRHFVIETDDMRLELEDTVSIRRRSFEATVGAAVTFALEKKTVYVRDSDGIEHKLRVVKKVERAGRAGGPG
jgi:hypothetical protein